MQNEYREVAVASWLIWAKAYAGVTQCLRPMSRTQQTDWCVQVAEAEFKSYSQVYVHGAPIQSRLMGWVRPRQRRGHTNSFHIFEGVRRLRESFEVLTVVLVGLIVWVSYFYPCNSMLDGPSCRFERT